MPHLALPELAALERGSEGIRIPPDVTVPVTARVRALLDTAELRRLARVSQLGLVALVYPGATHSRLEHSLGVYRLALAFLARLRHDPDFTAVVGEEDAAAFVAAALVHDVGHWPYCHPLEDLGLPGLPRHESLVGGILGGGAAGEVLRRDWRLDPARVAALVAGTATDRAGVLLQSLLSGPVDVDKMDYLARDSLHAGVPYGRHFDQERLLASLCVDRTGTRLAITDKGRTAAELMVFARYVMFSEVYWHHAVRSATGMLQRAVWLIADRVDPRGMVGTDDAGFVSWLRDGCAGSAAEPLAEGLFGPVRTLLKRVATYDAVSHPEIHKALAGRGYADSVVIAGRLADRLSARLGIPVDPATLLVDAPPAEREVEFRLEVKERSRDTGEEDLRWRSLGELSPVVRSLAREQFDDLVKRVRIFAPRATAKAVRTIPGGLAPDLLACLD